MKKPGQPIQVKLRYFLKPERAETRPPEDILKVIFAIGIFVDGNGETVGDDDEMVAVSKVHVGVVRRRERWLLGHLGVVFILRAVQGKDPELYELHQSDSEGLSDWQARATFGELQQSYWQSNN
jgi:hypothetical protein